MRNPNLKTCQCCNRAIMSKKGLIAHHGYERPHLQHYQTASCYGARHAPFECSREALGSLIKLLQSQLKRQKSFHRATVKETEPVTFTYNIYRGFNHKEPVHVTLTRDTFEAEREKHKHEFIKHGMYDFERAKQAQVRRIEYSIKQTMEALTHCQARYDGWKQTHIYRDGSYIAL